VVAPIDSAVPIQGPTRAGKAVIARTIRGNQRCNQKLLMAIHRVANLRKQKKLNRR
jgi:transcriptional regulator with GAF, ATPase, and Fis domain